MLWCERFSFGSRNEAEIVRDSADLLIDHNGYITMAQLFSIIFNGKSAVWPGMEDFLDNWGWTDTFCWEVKQEGWSWVLDTPEPKRLFVEEGESHD